MYMQKGNKNQRFLTLVKNGAATQLFRYAQ
jgi:hypothetical protein